MSASPYEGTTFSCVSIKMQVRQARSAGVAREPLRHRLATPFIEQEVKLGAAEQEIFRGERVLGLRGIVELGPGDAGSDFFRRAGTGGDGPEQRLDLVAIGEGKAFAGRERNGLRP